MAPDWGAHAITSKKAAIANKTPVIWRNLFLPLRHFIFL